MRKRILVAGIGNIFLGDDAFGVEAAHALMQRELPPEVRVIDCGIRSYDLAFALLDGYDAVILVDATPLGQPAGTAYLIEPDLTDLEQPQPAANAHHLNPVRALQMVQSLGGRLGRLYLAGCEPAVLETKDGQIGLSQHVKAAVPRVLDMIESLIRDLLLQDRNDEPGLIRA